MTPTISAHQKILRLQKKIFRSLQAEVSTLFGETPKSIQEYERENQKDFRQGPLRSIQKSDLISAVKKTDVTFIADFHTFDQAQRTALRIMREAIPPEIKPNETWYIGLEMVSSQFQSSLDQFQEGKISVETFHKTISYNEEWGFPWSNYAPIFEWAKENQIRLIALNRPKAFSRSDKEELHKRDQWAAGIITDLFHGDLQKKIHPKMIVLYGELHVGSHHLPQQLTKISKSFLDDPLSWITIHQNHNGLFWKLAQKHRELQTETIQLKKNIFCVFSSTPWAKLQSLVNWAEGESLDNSPYDTSFESDLDYLSIFRSYGDTISEFIGVTPPSYETITLCTIDQIACLKSSAMTSQLSSNERRLVQFHITHNHRLYIPRVSIAYLGSPSLNNAAELAAIHLLRSKNKLTQLMNKDLDDFYRMTMEFTFGFFGSLVLNHKRKCDLPMDHSKRIQDLKNGSKPRFQFELEARQIVLDFLRKNSSPSNELKKLLSQNKHGPTVMMGARYLGQILGKRLHLAVLKESLAMEKIRSLFLTPSDGSSDFFQNRYLEMMKAVSSVPVATTKEESL